MDAILLYAHGARDPQWAEPVRRIAERLADRRPDAYVACAYLEHLPPDLATAVADARALGARRVTLVPLFLGRGGHLQRDLPEIVARVEALHGDVSIRVMPSLGEAPEVLDAIAGWIAGVMG